ncbi:MAG: nitroreductase family protein [Campylobacteraceae bacterium]|nr:nitroreductase family protein [Campylobacteraceae bacterium]
MHNFWTKSTRQHLRAECVYISKKQPSIADSAAIQSGFYNAPTVLTLFAPKNFLYFAADSYVAAQNIMLASHSLGIGSYMVAHAKDTLSSELGQWLQKEWDINETYEATIHVTLGYPAGDTLPTAKLRKDSRVIRVGGQPRTDTDFCF